MVLLPRLWLNTGCVIAGYCGDIQMTQGSVGGGEVQRRWLVRAHVSLCVALAFAHRAQLCLFYYQVNGRYVLERWYWQSDLTGFSIQLDQNWQEGWMEDTTQEHTGSSQLPIFVLRVYERERERDDGAWWGVNGVTWQTGVGNWRVEYIGKTLSGAEDGVAVVMETSHRGNGPFSRQTVSQTGGGLLSVWIWEGYVGMRRQRPHPHTCRNGTGRIQFGALKWLFLRKEIRELLFLL